MMTDAKCREVLGVMLTFARAGDEPTDAMRADAIAHALARLALLDDALAALGEIADHPHISYDHPTNLPRGEYGTGCADGHRCAVLDRAALAGPAASEGA
jgi:hypothetical protein